MWLRLYGQRLRNCESERTISRTKRVIVRFPIRKNNRKTLTPDDSAVGFAVLSPAVAKFSSSQSPRRQFVQSEGNTPDERQINIWCSSMTPFNVILINFWNLAFPSYFLEKSSLMVKEIRLGVKLIFLLLQPNTDFWTPSASIHMNFPNRTLNVPFPKRSLLPHWLHEQLSRISWWWLTVTDVIGGFCHWVVLTRVAILSFLVCPHSRDSYLV